MHDIPEATVLDDPWLYGPLAIVAAAFVLSFFLTVGVSLWEKRPLAAFEIPPDGGEFDLTAAAERANGEAEDLGYEYLGVRNSGAAAKGIRVRYDFWLSPDRLTVAIVGGGTALKIPVFIITMWSRSSDGVALLCTGNHAENQVITPDVRQVTWPKAHFDLLESKHAGRLVEEDVAPYSDDPIAEGEGISRTIVAGMVARGTARYAGDPPSAWRYTLRGALQFYFETAWILPFRRRLRSLGLLNDG